MFSIVYKYVLTLSFHNPEDNSLIKKGVYCMTVKI